MKKLLIAALALSLTAFAVTAAHAEEKYVAGGFEASGHIVTGFGYQHQTTNGQPNVTAFGGAGVGGVGTGSLVVDSEGRTSAYGVLGEYLPAAPGGKDDNFQFFVDQVQLDMSKSFGENIRLRTDWDFFRGVTGGGLAQGANGTRLEQAYAAANIPVGNGLEFLVGRFHAPGGFEPIAVAEQDLISHTAIVRANLRPTGLTGAKLYYSFSDMVDAHLYVANTIGNGVNQDSVKPGSSIPSAGFRLGFNWGEEGSQSTIGLNGFGGPETTDGFKKKISVGGDLDWNWWITEAFAFGGEGLYRRDPKDGGPNMQIFAGLANLHYVFSDVWDGTLRYAYTKQNDFSNQAVVSAVATNKFTGFQGYSNEISLGGSYAVADGAKVKLEGRFDWVKDTAAVLKAYDYGAALAFVYTF